MNPSPDNTTNSHTNALRQLGVTLLAASAFLILLLCIMVFYVPHLRLAAAEQAAALTPAQQALFSASNNLKQTGMPLLGLLMLVALAGLLLRLLNRRS